MVRWSLWDPSISGITTGATTECAGAVAASVETVSTKELFLLLLKLFAAAVGAAVGIFD